MNEKRFGQDFFTAAEALQLIQALLDENEYITRYFSTKGQEDIWFHGDRLMIHGDLETPYTLSDIDCLTQSEVEFPKIQFKDGTSLVLSNHKNYYPGSDEFNDNEVSGCYEANFPRRPAAYYSHGKEITAQLLQDRYYDFFWDYDMDNDNDCFWRDHTEATRPIEDTLPDGYAVLRRVKELGIQNDEFIVLDGRLMWYNGSARHLIIPEGVTAIAAGFLTFSKVEEITFPSTLEKIERRAFWGCEELKKVTYKKMPEVIESGAFRWAEFETVTPEE